MSDCSTLIPYTRDICRPHYPNQYIRLYCIQNVFYMYKSKYTICYFYKGKKLFLQGEKGRVE